MLIPRNSDRIIRRYWVRALSLIIGKKKEVPLNYHLMRSSANWQQQLLWKKIKPQTNYKVRSKRASKEKKIII